MLSVVQSGAGSPFVLAEITGDDGPSHNGIWDLALLGLVPGLSIAARRDATTLRDELREAVRIDNHPTAIRFPRDRPARTSRPSTRSPAWTLLAAGADPDVLLVPVGVMAATALAVAERLASHGIGPTVVDPRWVKPVNAAFGNLADGYRVVVTIEDGCLAGGFGSALAAHLQGAGVTVPVRAFGVQRPFPPHGTRTEVLEACHLAPRDIARDVIEVVAGLDSHLDVPCDASVGRG